MYSSPIKSPLLVPMTPQGVKDERPGFKEFMKQAVVETNNKQLEAHKSMEEIATGKSANIHETMIAIQKAEVSFKMMMQVRNKVMNAYQEVMRMQV